MADWLDTETNEELEHFSNEVPAAEGQRYGGAQGEDDEEDDERRRREERERKKAEVRARLEAANANKKKKGFLTPERKKKLRKLLMMKAAEDLKQQQLQKQQERQKALDSRIVKLPDLENMNDQGALLKLAQDLWKRLADVEASKFDLEYAVKANDFQINELTIAVNDLRGKFVKPTLKKVSKYDSKFKKMGDSKEVKSGDFRNNLKQTKKVDKFMEELKADAGKKSEAKAEAPKEDAPAAEVAAEA